MFKTISKLTIAAAAVVALPGMAQAGTATASGTATMSVASQCSVTGANVNLGSFNINNTWGTVIAQNGGWTGATLTTGSQGVEYANFGSVTCDNGMPYTLAIAGSGSVGLVRLTIGGKTAVMAPFIKKVGGVVVADNYVNGPGLGAGVYGGLRLSATGTGTAQTLLGSLQTDLSTGATLSTDKLTTAGTYSDTLTYTLNF